MYNDKLQTVWTRMPKKTLIAGLASGYSKGIQFVFYFLAYFYASYLLEWETYTADRAMKVIFILLMGGMGMGQVAAMGADIQKANEAVPKIFSLIDMLPKSIDFGPINRNDELPDQGQILESIKGEICLENVSFRYPSRPDVKILRGVSLTVEAGKTVALVGESGSGKSTIIQLIERFYDPEQGSVTLDGINLKDINLKSLRNHISLVGQEPVLFASTIANNIRYGKENATDEEMKEAARNANIADFIESLDSKYDTFAGASGTQLSGGQKQRVAIARAIIRNPRILLLDEATAALDSESEKIVQDALDKLMHNRTTVVIAHRLSTIQDADLIVVMGKGKIREEGTHQALLKENGIYQKLCTQQKL